MNGWWPLLLIAAVFGAGGFAAWWINRSFPEDAQGQAKEHIRGLRPSQDVMQKQDELAAKGAEQDNSSEQSHLYRRNP